MKFFLVAILGGALGFFLAQHGMPFTTWQFWFVFGVALCYHVLGSLDF